MQTKYMLRFKSIVYLLVVCIMISITTMPVPIAALDNEHVDTADANNYLLSGIISQFNPMTGIVKVSGELNRVGDEQYVTLLAVPSGTDVNALNASDVLYMEQVQLVEKQFNIQFRFSGRTDGTVDIYIGGTDIFNAVKTGVSPEFKYVFVDSIELDMSDITALAYMENYTEADKKVVMLITQYDSTGKVLNVSMEEKNVPANTYAPVKYSLSMEELHRDTACISAYVWESLTSLVPLCEPVECMGIGDALDLKSVVMSFKGDAQSSRGFAWVTDTIKENMVVQYAKNGEEFETSYNEVNATFTEHENDFYYKADVEGLEAGCEYIYRIGDLSYNSWSDYYSFETEGMSDEEYSFVVFADPQGSSQSNYNVLQNLMDVAMTDIPDAKFMVCLGDAVDAGYSTQMWQLYFDALSEYTPEIPLMSIVGNHETRDDKETAYDDAGLDFNLRFNNSEEASESIKKNLEGVSLSGNNQAVADNIDGSVYSFDYGDVHFVVLNSGSDWHTSSTLKLLQAQTEWLEEDLASTQATWKIVMIHQGLYPAKEERYFGSRDILEPIMDEYNVDLVLQGHDHMVARTYPMRAGSVVSTDTPELVEKGEGTVYFIPGAAANKRYDDLTAIPSYMDIVINTESKAPVYSKINVLNDKMEIITVDINGNIVDAFEISKN